MDSLIQLAIQQKPDILKAELCQYLEINTGVKIRALLNDGMILANSE